MIEKLIEKAKKEICACRELIKKGYYEIVLSRSYYCMFYCAKAILLFHGVNTKTHSGTISKFVLIAKSDDFNIEIAKYLARAFRKRQFCDYDFSYDVVYEEASQMLKYAEEFLNETIRYLKEKGVLK